MMDLTEARSYFEATLVRAIADIRASSKRAEIREIEFRTGGQIDLCYEMGMLSQADRTSAWTRLHTTVANHFVELKRSKAKK